MSRKLASTISRSVLPHLSPVASSKRGQAQIQLAKAAFGTLALVSALLLTRTSRWGRALPSRIALYGAAGTAGLYTLLSMQKLFRLDSSFTTDSSRPTTDPQPSKSSTTDDPVTLSTTPSDSSEPAENKQLSKIKKDVLALEALNLHFRSQLLTQAEKAAKRSPSDLEAFGENIDQLKTYLEEGQALLKSSTLKTLEKKRNKAKATITITSLGKNATTVRDLRQMICVHLRTPPSFTLSYMNVELQDEDLLAPHVRPASCLTISWGEDRAFGWEPFVQMAETINRGSSTSSEPPTEVSESREPTDDPTQEVKELVDGLKLTVRRDFEGLQVQGQRAAAAGEGPYDLFKENMGFLKEYLRRGHELLGADSHETLTINAQKGEEALTLELPLHDDVTSVGDLRQMICASVGVLPAFELRGTKGPLQDSATLEDMGIKKGSTLSAELLVSSGEVPLPIENTWEHFVRPPVEEPPPSPAETITEEIRELGLEKRSEAYLIGLLGKVEGEGYEEFQTSLRALKAYLEPAESRDTTDSVSVQWTQSAVSRFPIGKETTCAHIRRLVCAKNRVLPCLIKLIHGGKPLGESVKVSTLDFSRESQISVMGAAGPRANEGEVMTLKEALRPYLDIT